MSAFITSSKKKWHGLNEHEELSNITLKTQTKVKQQCLYFYNCCSTFHSHSLVYNNEPNSYQPPSRQLSATIFSFFLCLSVFFPFQILQNFSGRLSFYLLKNKILYMYTSSCRPQDVLKFYCDENYVILFSVLTSISDRELTITRYVCPQF